MKSPVTKLAAAAVLIVGVVIFSLIVSPGVTFADVIKPLFEAKTFAYDLLVGGEGGPVARDHVSGNRIRRTMSTGPNIVLIIDADAAKLLRLDTTGKTAALVDIAGPLEKHARDYIAFVRETIERLMADPNFEPEEQFQRQIDGRKAIGYSLGNDRERVTILADAKTGAPLQIELEWGRETCILKNFEFNIPISEDQISLDPPAGYTMRQTQMDFSNLSEKDLVESLRVWAKYFRDGTFPPQLLKQEYVKQIPLFREKIGGLSIPDAEKEQLLTYYSRVTGAPYEAYSALSMADMKNPDITLASGEEVTVSRGAYSNILATNRNQADRRLAFEAHYQTSTQWHSETFSKDYHLRSQ